MSEKEESDIRNISSRSYRCGGDGTIYFNNNYDEEIKKIKEKQQMIKRLREMKREDLIPCSDQILFIIRWTNYHHPEGKIGERYVVNDILTDNSPNYRLIEKESQNEEFRKKFLNGYQVTLEDNCYEAIESRKDNWKKIVVTKKELV